MISLYNNFFKQIKNEFVAINLGNRYIKGLFFEANRVKDFFIKAKGDISSTLKEVWQENKISTDKVRLSLKDPATLVRYFTFPKLEKKKLKQTLFYELNKHIPFSPNEVYFDFSILEEISPSEVSLVLAVAKKSFIDSVLDIFQKEKLRVLDITLDSISLINLFLNSEKDPKVNSCILDIGGTLSTLTIFKKNTPFLTRDLNFSAQDICGMLSRIKNMPLAEIEKWIGLGQNHKEALELTQDTITSLCKEVKSSFDYFEVNKGEHIEKLYLSGGVTYISGIDSLFKDYLGIEVDFLAKAANVNISVGGKDFQNMKNSFSVALGLVL